MKLDEPGPNQKGRIYGIKRRMRSCILIYTSRNKREPLTGLGSQQCLYVLFFICVETNFVDFKEFCGFMTYVRNW